MKEAESHMLSFSWVFSLVSFLIWIIEPDLAIPPHYLVFKHMVFYHWDEV